ncbi:hypothetical protein GCM10010992_01180 [Cloacibacterium rupense]|uniref:DUF4349 domain-containing protein n=1 Tax=Cloacibacterium rupense TaxID=517423 RepID=A0ABQ2NH50_9FLAO|nr:DUF4349 domain-containing protein [Cloacibacterium rupense]GGP01281.1 hypothetical protein GCM10010992_01180 [Cloacibacterium rupense]
MKTIIYSLAILSLLACGKNEATQTNVSLMEVLPEDEVATKAYSPDSPPKLQMPIPEAKPIDKAINLKKIIKSGDMTIEVADIKTAQEKIQNSVKYNKAYIQNERFSNSETQTTLSMEIRIPNQNFDQLVNSFSDEIGSITQKNIRVEDVTEEYTDVSIRLKNKLAYLEKYRDLLKRSASTKDLIEIQEKIRGLEEEIESSEGRLRYIDDQVNYSTLDLTLIREKPRNTVTSKIGFGSRLIDSVANGWNIFVNFFLGVVSLWPFLFIIPFIIFFWRKWRKRKSKKE